MGDIRNLEAFLGNLAVDPRPADESDIEREINAIYKSRAPWTVWTNPPWNDFTRELIEPGHAVTTEAREGDATYAEGALIIRGDTNFWMVAALPRKFETIPLADIVKTIWPHIEQPKLYPDDGSIYWEALGNQDMEVPGEPYELWVECHCISESEREHSRLGIYARADELSSALKSANSRNGEQTERHSENSARYYGLTWKEGVRLPFVA